MKQLHENHEFRFNEILFEHRNKEYGAYVLRNESDRILTKALFVGVSMLAAVSVTPLIISAFNSAEVPPVTGTEYTLPPPVDVSRPDSPPVSIVPPKATPDVKTFDNRLPEPKAHVTNEKVIEKIEGAVEGVKNNSVGEIAPPNIHVPTVPTIGTGPVAPPNIQPSSLPAEDPNAVAGSGELSVEASFVGGIDAFRNRVINNFDGSGFESDDLMKTTITFIVEIDGTISAIKATGNNADFNNEAIRTIKSIKGKWVPGKNKQGKAVRSYFTFPISMKFDN